MCIDSRIVGEGTSGSAQRERRNLGTFTSPVNIDRLTAYTLLAKFPKEVTDRPNLHSRIFTFAGLFHSDASTVEHLLQRLALFSD